MRRRTGMLVTAVLAATMVGGCAGSEGSVAPTGSAPAAATYPVTVGNLTLAKRPEKIVVLSPSATEMLFAIGAGPQVTAADDNSNFPPEAPRSDLSGFKPNAEAIAAKEPDLVVLSNDLNKVVDQLGKLKIPVLMTPSAVTLDDTYRQITELGTLTGHSSEAADLVARMKQKIDAAVSALPRRATPLSYYYELDPTLYTATSKTFIGSLLTMMQLRNVADPADPGGAKGGYPQLSQEALIKANPDLIFLADTKCCQQSVATVQARTGWAGITAVKTGQVIGLDDDIASRWGPRVVDLVQTIAGAVARIPA